MDIKISGLPNTINEAELQAWVKRFVEMKLSQPTKEEQAAQIARQTLAREAVNLVSVKSVQIDKPVAEPIAEPTAVEAKPESPPKQKE
jgi:hypothetical protein